jgi:hypothetical protein
MRTSFRPARRRAPRTGRWPHQPGTQTRRRTGAATCGQHRVPNPRKPVGVNQSYFSCFVSHVSILMFHLHPSGNGRCGSNGLSPLKACAIQPLRATLGATAETNCLGLGQRARLRHDRNLARSAGRGEGCQARKVSRPYCRRASHHRSTALSEWIGVSVRTTFRLELVVLPMRTDRPRRRCRVSIPLARSGHHPPCDARASAT